MLCTNSLFSSICRCCYPSARCSVTPTLTTPLCQRSPGCTRLTSRSTPSVPRSGPRSTPCDQRADTWPFQDLLTNLAQYLFSTLFINKIKNFLMLVLWCSTQNTKMAKTNCISKSQIGPLKPFNRVAVEFQLNNVPSRKSQWKNGPARKFACKI